MTMEKMEGFANAGDASVFKVPADVLAYASALTMLRRATGLEILSFDNSEAKLVMPSGLIFFPVWNDDAQRYDVEFEARQLREIQAAGGIKEWLVSVNRKHPRMEAVQTGD